MIYLYLLLSKYTLLFHFISFFHNSNPISHLLYYLLSSPFCLSVLINTDCIHSAVNRAALAEDWNRTQNFSTFNAYKTSYKGFSKKEKKLARSFTFTFCYIDDVISLNISRFGDFVDRIYPIELEIKDTTDTERSASYFDLYFKIDSEGWLRTKLYAKRDDFNFPIVNLHLYVATFRQHLHMEYTSLSWYDIPEFVVPIKISLIEGCC